MANSYPSPCDKCTEQKGCHGCTDWKIRYLYRQKQINAYAAEMRKPKPLAKNKLRYEHTDIVRQYLATHPCAGCKRESVCDTPCAKFMLWYDVKMQWIKGRIGL